MCFGIWWPAAASSLSPASPAGWTCGLMQVMRYHYRMMGNPRYGVIGLVAMPYYLFFEMLGPVIEAAGYIVTAGAVYYGMIDWTGAQIMFLVAIVYGALISLAAVALEELSFRRYLRIQDLALLIVLGLLENFGYRQLTTWWRLRGTVDYFRGKSGWGTMKRKGFGTTPTVEGTPTSSG